MPSRDKINKRANEWMEHEGIDLKAPVAAKPKRQDRQMAAQIQRIARRLGMKPDDLAEKMKDDTIRRLKYPVLEQRNPDGTRTFEHDLGIQTDGRLHT